MSAAILPHLKIEPLGTHHDHTGFTCGIESLDRYFKAQANQDVKRKASGVFVLVYPREPAQALGYYALRATALAHGDVPVAALKHVPRYPLVSATLVGRLAVASHRQKNGLGALLLADAVQRSYASANSVGSSMLIVDAINEQVAAFYGANGFLRLPDSLRLILPMQAIAKLMEA